MANEEHLEILKKGVEEWNAWRDESGEKPDLRWAKLINANLKGANLEGVKQEESALDNEQEDVPACPLRDAGEPAHAREREGQGMCG